jgi:uncharacterized protein (TIGR02599 family)
MKPNHQKSGFTLVEVLVAAAIIVVLMGVLLAMTDQTQRVVRSTAGKVEQFQGARVGFEAMTRRLAQATLNTYWDYDNPTQPTRYVRSAELRFRSGPMKDLTGGVGPNQNRQPGHGVFFHAPLGSVLPPTGSASDQNLNALDHLINTWGYFVEVGSDADSFPPFLQAVVTPRRRYRLMELMQPSEKLGIYTPSAQSPLSTIWFAPLVNASRPTGNVRVLADNIVALIVLPRLSVADETWWKTQKGSKTPPVLAPNYRYDSSDPSNPNKSDSLLNTINQLPPVVQVVMVAIDEPSAKRLEDQYGTSDPGALGISYSPDPKSGNNLFIDPATLDDNAASGKKGDLTLLQELLASKKASYRVFSSNVSIRGAKWSRGQIN